MRALIDAEPDLTVCAEAASLEDGLDETRPDLVIADLSLGPDDPDCGLPGASGMGGHYAAGEE